MGISLLMAIVRKPRERVQIRSYQILEMHPLLTFSLWLAAADSRCCRKLRDWQELKVLHTKQQKSKSWENPNSDKEKNNTLQSTLTSLPPRGYSRYSLGFTKCYLSLMNSSKYSKYNWRDNPIWLKVWQKSLWRLVVIAQAETELRSCCGRSCSCAFFRQQWKRKDVLDWISCNKYPDCQVLV